MSSASFYKYFHVTYTCLVPSETLGPPLQFKIKVLWFRAEFGRAACICSDGAICRAEEVHVVSISHISLKLAASTDFNEEC